eukprot:SAG31_NODE_913_length_11064_cov_4.529594_7_plen_203_part_00
MNLPPGQITGGGTGIGRELALLFAREGCDLILWGRRLEPLEAVKDEVLAIAEAGRFEGVSVRVNSIDVGDETAVARAAEQILAAGPVDILVNNAGIHLGPEPLQRYVPCSCYRMMCCSSKLTARSPPEVIRKVFDVNTLSHFWMLGSFLPAMLAKNHGHILTVASAAVSPPLAEMFQSSSKLHCFKSFPQAFRPLGVYVIRQ